MKAPFGALEARSHFSIGESLLSPKNIVKRAKMLGYHTVALADTMSISGLPDLAAQCGEEELDYLIGCRLRVIQDLDYRAPKPKDLVKPRPNREWFPKVFVRNSEGLQDLFRLLSLANDERHFYKVPRLSWEDVVDALEKGNLVFATGDIQGLFSCQGDDYHWATLLDEALASKAQTIVEITPMRTPLFDKLNQIAFGAAAERNLSMRFVYPALYDDRTDANARDVLATIIANQEMKNETRRLIPYIRDYALVEPTRQRDRALELFTRLKKRGIEKSLFLEAVRSDSLLLALCSYRFEKLPPSLPKMADDEFAELVGIIKDGWKRRLFARVFGYRPPASELPRYKARLEYELSVLKKMGFERYFLLVHDIVTWSRDQGIETGPGRGSIGGSLVAFLMGITDVDPLRFGLLFERFINPDRIDLPDADLDFLASRREEVFDYLEEKYGKDRVAGIRNYMKFASASSFRDCGRVHGLSPDDMSATKLVPKEHGKSLSLAEAAEKVPELMKLRDQYPEYWALAQSLDGCVKTMGRHAAGVVVADISLIERAVIEKASGGLVINWDKRSCEDFGLVKMDVLGLSTLDLIMYAARFIWERHKTRVDYRTIPLDDSKVLEAFGRGDTTGCFQFDSGGMKKLLRDLAESTSLIFDDLSVATSLYRPGPLDSGLLDDYVAIKRGVKSPHYDHPNAEEALKDTFGVMVYQEQVMQVSRDVAGFSPAEADNLRKVMGKKDKEKMKKLRDQWVAGCHAKSGMNEEAAGELFDKIEKFAGYGFNKSHACSYSLLSYVTMWLKVYYPPEFYAAALSIEKDDAKRIALVQDAAKRKIVVVPPDVNLSGIEFTIRDNPATDEIFIYTPFGAVKGISENGAKAIVEARSKVGTFANREQFRKAVPGRLVNIRKIETLDKVGTFASIEPGSLSARHPDRVKDQIELMPGLVIDFVQMTRVCNRSLIENPLKEMYKTWRDNVCDGCSLQKEWHIEPRSGKKIRFMVVTDCPSSFETRKEKLLEGEAGVVLKEAIKDAGLSVAQGYFTTLVKAPKSDRLTPAQIGACSLWLEKEIELVQPSVIVCMGGNVSRHFAPDLKGGIEELAGRVVYSRKYDANIVLGINPGMLFYKPHLEEVIRDVFRKVALMLS
jgi:DNA polymerase-3 subunit alpha